MRNGEHTASYTYLPNGLRKTKQVDDGALTTHIWNQNAEIVAEIGSDRQVVLNKYIYGLDRVLCENAANDYYYGQNSHGDTICLILDETPVVDASFSYDAFGNLTAGSSVRNANSFRYCGEYFDQETDSYYLRARYYQPALGRFISEDTHWNTGNMIYWDSPTGLPNVAVIIQSTNLYVYCMNNPVKYKDPTGRRSQKDADQIIKDNAQFIISAAAEFGVNPGILAATIYAEQRLNVDWKDDIIDGIIGFYGIADTSIGIGQIKISTAKFLEEKGYMPKVTAADGGWDIPGIGFVSGTEQMAREKILEDPETNIRYAAAYCSFIQDTWKDSYPEIDGRTAIVATVYNLGTEKTSPNANPKPNDFGTFAKDNYYYVRSLMGI